MEDICYCVEDIKLFSSGVAIAFTNQGLKREGCVCVCVCARLCFSKLQC